MKEFSSLRNANRAGLTDIKLAALVLAAIGGLTVAPLAQADSGWQWLDASGQKVFSDMPPPANVPTRNIMRRPANTGMLQPLSGMEPVPAGTPTGQTGSASSLEQPARPSTALTDAQLRAAVEQRNAEIRQQNCKQARDALSTLSSEQPLVTTDSRGEQVLLSNEARATEIRRLRQAEQDNCKPPAASRAQ